MTSDADSGSDVVMIRASGGDITGEVQGTVLYTKNSLSGCSRIHVGGISHYHIVQVQDIRSPLIGSSLRTCFSRWMMACAVRGNIDHIKISIYSKLNDLTSGQGTAASNGYT